MRYLRNPRRSGPALVLAWFLAGGCYSTPIDTSEYGRGPAPLRMPSPAKLSEPCQCYEDELTGGQIFSMYCTYCHNVSLAERPFSNYKNVASHMRVRANLTGKEYAKLMEFLRRWHDVPPPVAPPGTTPKRLTFSQPISELRTQDNKPEQIPPPGVQPPQSSAPNLPSPRP